ncbi:ABC transporter substrate-binding protein [Nocardia wallacei]|uniref:ABC transporter substrate-binding protein n=1 Tax=Nocardia wallacei TaxID=480035 RepID=UPI002457E376|nr:ABC transporter substrate-binding protein [Nocardia wallacei]
MDSPDASEGPVADAPLPTAVPPGTQLVVADQQELLQSALRASGELERLPFEVRFADFIGGPAVLEAFRAEAADIAPVGVSFHALTDGRDVPIVAAWQYSSTAFELAVAPGRPVRTLADLRGRKVAYAPGTAQQAAVLRALSKAGLTLGDVEAVRLPLADFNDAVRTGQVDVAPLDEPRLTRFFRTPGATVLPDAETAGIYPGLGYLYARRAVVRDPAKAAAVRAFVAAFIRSFHWANTHPQEWARRYYMENQKVSAEDATRILNALDGNVFPHLDQRLIDRQQQILDLIHQTGELRRQPRAADGFDLRFDEVITRTVTEVGAAFDRPSG